MTEEASTPSETPTPQTVMAAKIEAITVLETQLEAYRGRATRLNARINDLTVGIEPTDGSDKTPGTPEEQLAELIGTYGVAVDRVMQTRIALYGAYSALFTPEASPAPEINDGDTVAVAGPDGRMYQGTYRKATDEVEVLDPDFPAHLFATGVTKDEAEVTRLSMTEPLTLNQMLTGHVDSIAPGQTVTVPLTGEAVEKAITPDPSAGAEAQKPDAPASESSPVDPTPTSGPVPDATPTAEASPTETSSSTVSGDVSATEVGGAA